MRTLQPNFSKAQKLDIDLGKKMEKNIPWLIAMLIIVMIVGPIMMIRPSPRQKRIAKMRAKANALGLMVRLEHAKSKKAVQVFASYIRPWESLGFRGSKQVYWGLANEGYEHESHFDGAWVIDNDKLSDAESNQLRKDFRACPFNVYGMRSDNVGLTAIVDEQCIAGSESDYVTKIDEWLTNMAKNMANT
ncbi:MAG: hypothetical protein ACI93R_002820 [Flavobacteriales bacterium]